MAAKCRHRSNNVATVVLNRDGGNSRPWAAFSGASFRRLIVSTVRCGGASYWNDDGGDESESLPDRPNEEEVVECGSGAKTTRKNAAGSERLSELLRLSESSETGLDIETAEEVKKKVEALEELKTAVTKLQGGDVLGGAVDVRRLTKEGSEARTNLALLGAIPPLVALLDSDEITAQVASLYALLNLGIGNDANKAAIVEAGSVHKMLKLIQSPNGYPTPPVAEAIVANFLGLSALDSNKPIIGSSGAIPFLVRMLKDSNSAQAKLDSLRALYNLSISPLNVSMILDTDLVPFLLNTLGDMEVSERVLSILSNVVATHEGRKAISVFPEAFPTLVDVLNWTDSPGCQEKATYILMVMAHKSYGDRQAMIEAGIVSALLELTLLGSTLAQKRASRILDSFRVDKGKEISENYEAGTMISPLSAPICGSSPADSNLQLKECLLEEEDMMSEERKAVKQLVQQSLQNNMKRIVKRANLPQDFVPSDHLKSLTASSTSKSLPF